LDAGDGNADEEAPCECLCLRDCRTILSGGRRPGIDGALVGLALLDSPRGWLADMTRTEVKGYYVHDVKWSKGEI